MKSESTNLNCPKCGTVIDVNAILYNQLQQDAEQKYEQLLAKQQSEFDASQAEIIKEKAAILKMKSELDASIEKGVTDKLLSEKIKLEKRIREQLLEEKSEELNSYKEQLNEKVKEVKELNRLKADYQKLHREKIDLKEKIEAEAQLKITNEVEQERKKIKKDLEAKSELLVAEKEHIIQQLKVQLSEASRKADQGSGQLRGEVMETYLEDYLRQCFPMDIIEEIKKGAKGGDSLHFVNSALQKKCGSIYYETKRTHDFQQSWIPKFKADMLARNADIGVLVTQTYPKGMERLSMKEGIWICTMEEAKGLCYVLRESLILLNEAKTAQTDKGGKMEIIYEYMVSNEFRMQMEAIVDSFITLQKNLSSEKRAMEAIWKQRQKQIENVIQNTTHIYSSIRAIAGNAVKPIKQLELTIGEESEVSPKFLINSKTNKK